MSLENNDFLINEQKKEDKSILFEDYKIDLLCKKEAAEFSEEHIEKIKKVLNLFSEINPEAGKGFSKFESINNPNAKSRGYFPRSAYIGYDNDKELSSIIFYNRGMDTNIAHRISSSDDSKEKGFVDNFSGTLAHELAHGDTSGARLFNDRKFSQDFVWEWQEKFGWKTITSTVKNKNTDKWEQSVIAEGWEKNKDELWQNNDYIVAGLEYTTMPEKCIGGKKGYAASTYYQEDICDSVAAYLLNPSVLDKEKYEFIKNKISEYKKVKTIQ